MGEPSQEINCELNFDISDYFMIYSPYNVKPIYNNSLSLSFKKNENQISSSRFSGGFCANENIYFYIHLKYKN